MISQITIRSTEDMVPNDATLINNGLKEYLDASRICVFPILENNKLTYTAYIQVREWSDCDAAYNIIKAMKDGKRVRIYVAGLFQLWDITATVRADLWLTGGANRWMTVFEKEDPYYEYDDEQQRISAF